MNLDNYPEDIRNYDNDPRSPFYDDGGEEAYLEERVDELMENGDELEIDLDEVVQFIFDFKDTDNFGARMQDFLIEQAKIHAAADWENRGEP